MIEYSDELAREMRQLHEKGVPTKEIALRFGVSTTTVRRWISGLRPGTSPKGGVGEFVGKDKPVTGGITRAEIEAVRRRTYVGAGILILTHKSSDPDASKGNLTGVPRMAVVADTSNPVFCMVRLRSGTLDSILWSDLALRARKKA